MPTLTKEQVPAAAPLFIGLQSYTEAQAERFFGRDEEIDRLTNLVKANTLTIVFGKSGTGKTSLLNAGVFPRLRKDYCLPFRIRLEFADDSPDLVSQIKQTLKTEIDKYGFKVESYPGEETLWEYFHREQLWKSVTPILIFDQFEEIFTLGKKSSRFGKEELDAFWEELADLIENSIPERIKSRFLDGRENLDFAYKVQKIKTLFSFREEFLPEFESITAKIPSLKYSRFRLLPMNGHQAYEVITKNWKGAINPGEAHKIVAFFSSDEEKSQPYELMTVEPSLLSQVCSLIEKERVQQGKEKISAEFLDKYSKEFILRSIYDEAMNESNRAVASNVAASSVVLARPMNEFAEDKLITDEGYRSKYALAESDAKLLPGIAVLKSKYFLRDEGKSIELTHDVLTPLIKHDREDRRKELALVTARKKARRRVMRITAFALIAALGFWGFTYITSRKAIQEREDAIAKTQALSAEIAVKFDSLSHVNDSLKAARLLLKDSLKNTIPQDKGTSQEYGMDSLLREQFSARHRKDSLELLALAQRLSNQKAEWEAKDSIVRAQMQTLSTTQKKTDSAHRSARMEIALLKRRLAIDSNELVRRKINYDELVKAQREFFLDDADFIQAKNVLAPFDEAADTASLKLALYYSGSQKAKVPNNLRVYLIPRTAANASLIRQASTYEIRCDEMNLDKAKGKKIGRYHNGSYVFLDVPPGNYFVKICTYYGGYYNIVKKEQGNEEKKLDASPPIR